MTVIKTKIIDGRGIDFGVLEVGNFYGYHNHMYNINFAKFYDGPGDFTRFDGRNLRYSTSAEGAIEDIVGGEGKVRVADTVWRARGPIARPAPGYG